METSLFSLIVYVPLSHADHVRSALAEAGAGKIGDYDSCSFSVRGTGRFRPLKGADPAIGTVGKMTEVEEERIEVVIPKDVDIAKVVEKLKAVHPYEEPAIQVIETIDYHDLA